jgi:hypothetical protein
VSLENADISVKAVLFLTARLVTLLRAGVARVKGPERSRVAADSKEFKETDEAEAKARVRAPKTFLRLFNVRDEKRISPVMEREVKFSRRGKELLREVTEGMFLMVIEPTLRSLGKEMEVAAERSVRIKELTVVSSGKLSWEMELKLSRVMLPACWRAGMLTVARPARLDIRRAPVIWVRLGKETEVATASLSMERDPAFIKLVSSIVAVRARRMLTAPVTVWRAGRPIPLPEAGPS